jgi:peroxiredoxin
MSTKVQKMVGQVLPDFALPSLRYGMMGISDFRGRRSLIVVFLGDGCGNPGHTLLAELFRRYHEVRAEEAEVVAVVCATRRELEATEWTYPFVVLEDEAGKVHERFGLDTTIGMAQPLVILTDRDGEICCTSRELPDLALGVTPILGWLEFVNSLCPE